MLQTRTRSLGAGLGLLAFLWLAASAGATVLTFDMSYLNTTNYGGVYS